MTPAEYVEGQFDIPWVRELLRQICFLAAKEREEGLPVVFTAIGVGKNHTKATNETKAGSVSIRQSLTVQIVLNNTNRFRLFYLGTDWLW